MNDTLTVLLGYDPPTGWVGRVIAWFTWGHRSHAKMAFIWPDGFARVLESRSDCGVIERAPEELPHRHVVPLADLRPREVPRGNRTR